MVNIVNIDALKIDKVPDDVKEKMRSKITSHLEKLPNLEVSEEVIEKLVEDNTKTYCEEFNRTVYVIMEKALLELENIESRYGVEATIIFAELDKEKESPTEKAEEPEKEELTTEEKEENPEKEQEPEIEIKYPVGEVEAGKFLIPGNHESPDDNPWIARHIENMRERKRAGKKAVAVDILCEVFKLDVPDWCRTGSHEIKYVGKDPSGYFISITNGEKIHMFRDRKVVVVQPPDKEEDEEPQNNLSDSDISRLDELSEMETDELLEIASEFVRVKGLPGRNTNKKLRELIFNHEKGRLIEFIENNYGEDYVKQIVPTFKAQ